MDDDAELLRRYTEAGSEPAFTEFVGRHLNLVYFTALRGTDGDAALAQDVTQSAFTLAARRAARLVSHPAITGWLYTTARQIAARARRKQRLRQRYENAAAIHDMITSGPDHDWDRLRPVIDDALDDLHPNEREAILVRFFEGRHFTNIGASWKVSQDAARMRVDRALEKLRLALERRGVSSVPSALAAVLAAQSSLAAPAGALASVTGAALTGAGAQGGVAALFSIMSGTKMMATAGVVVVALATGTAVVEYREATTTKLRLTAMTRELVSVRSELARTTQRMTVAESSAREADKDSGALLTALQSARPKSVEPPNNLVTSASTGSSALNDPLAQTLLALFPNGIVAVLGNRSVTVEDVRREIAPQLAKLQQESKTPEEMRQRLYALQNGIIADLVTRQLNIKEFNNQVAGEAPKHIAVEMVDMAIADRVKEQFNGDQSSFLQSLNAQGITLAQYRQKVEEDIAYGYMRGQQRRLAQSKDSPVKTPAP